MTKLTLENEYGIYSVENRKDDPDLAAVIEFLVIPVLLAAGYHQNSIDEALGDDLPKKLPPCPGCGM